MGPAIVCLAKGAPSGRMVRGGTDGIGILFPSKSALQAMSFPDIAFFLGLALFHSRIHTQVFFDSGR